MQGARQQVGQGEEATLAAVQDVQVLDRVVGFPVLGIAQPVAVVAFEQHSDEGMEEMQMLGRRREGERVDGDAVLPEGRLEIAALEQGRQLAVAVPEVEDDRQRVVLLRVGDQEVQQEALAAAGGAQHERVPDVVDVQVEAYGVRVRCLEHGECLAPQVRADRRARDRA